MKKFSFSSRCPRLLRKEFVACWLGLALPCGTLYAGDSEVAAAPTENAIAQYSGGEAPATVSWYFTSDSPHRERQIAQTVLMSSDAVAKHFALQMANSSLEGFGDDAEYELKVYESASRPEKQFINRNVVLTQEGVVRDGAGKWLVFPLDEELNLKASHYYTFVLRFTVASKVNRVLMTHSKGDADGSFRWHRSGRDSWVASPMSLHYMLY